MRFFDIVVATSINNAIGEKGEIPWKISRDLKWFQKITTLPTNNSNPSKNIIIMGRKTWESLPRKPLPNRMNFIITRTVGYHVDTNDNVCIFDTFEKALQKSIDYPYSNVFVIGGEEIYKQALKNPWVRYIYKTTIDRVFTNADKFFPDIEDHESHFVDIYTSKAFEENGLGYRFQIWTRKATFLWWTDKNCYEYDWLSHCFANIPCHHVVDTDCTLQVPNAVIITNQLITKEESFQRYEDHHVPYHLVHLSDEYLDDKYGVYNNSSCRTVHRNYFHPFIGSKAITFGIGPKSNFWEGIPSDQIDIYRSNGFDERPYVWSFAGYIKKSDRTLICKMFQSLEPNFIHSSMGFNNGILNTDIYRNKIIESKFVLCPIGNCSLDTFRIYEALEGGAIPVTLYTNVNQGFIRYVSNYWKYVFYSEHLPFVVSNSWEENLEKVKYLLQNPNVYNQLKAEMDTFWKDYKTRLQRHFTEVFSHELFLRPPRNILDIIEM